MKGKLEAETERLTQDIEAVRSEVVSIKQAYSNLKRRLDALEKKQTFSGPPVIKSLDALYGIAESYYKKENLRKQLLNSRDLLTLIPRILECQIHT